MIRRFLRPLRRVLRRLRPPVVRFFQRRVIARGIDRTSSIATGRAVILAPHPDDEAIGCGSLIALKAAAGTEVTVVIATDGRRGERSRQLGHDELARVRRAEAIAAGQALGLEASAIRFLDFEDGSLEANRTPLQDALGTLLAELAPEEVYAPQADRHADHRALSEVARTLDAGTGVRRYEYAVRYWGSVPWLRPPSGRIRAALYRFTAPIHEWRRPPAMIVSTEGVLDRKLAALEVYAGEMQFVGMFVFPYAHAGYELFFPAEATRRLSA